MLPCSFQLPFESLDDPSSVARAVPFASVTKRLIPREILQALTVLSVPFAFTFLLLALPPNFGLPLKKTMDVFFFLPAIATALNRPTPSAATARTAKTLPALI